ncbi:aldehyde dehydrogenase family protein [Phytophthora cinnamomi]|uniref:aldehyde dehydrogenase family protein n=1 Tax=Phytophthora cinnamomi TaxID=4785 RepID=UPI003559CE2A|nr:aldehyde dehydrogenase family protein [Phytophthora cinnamomi]
MSDPIPTLKELFIDGKWVAPVRQQYLDVLNPATEEVVQQRAVYLRAMAAMVEKRTEALSRLETIDNGKPLAEAVWDMEDVAGCFQYYAKAAEALDKRQYEKKLVTETEKLVLGDPLDEKVQMGPLVSKPQQQKVLGYISSAKDAGATIAQGTLPSEGKGYFVPPTIITNVKPDMRVWKEEIFGPVLSVMTFKTEEEAVALANDSEFGLAAAVFTSDDAQLKRVTKNLRAGIVWNNCSQPCFVELPWGGVKKSGIGRELGPFGLNAYLEPKQICTYVADKPFAWYLKA